MTLTTPCTISKSFIVGDGGGGELNNDFGFSKSGGGAGGGIGIQVTDASYIELK